MKTACFHRINTFEPSSKVKLEVFVNGVSACEEEVVSAAPQRKLSIQEAPQTNIRSVHSGLIQL